MYQSHLSYKRTAINGENRDTRRLGPPPSADEAVCWFAAGYVDVNTAENDSTNAHTWGPEN